MSSETASTTPSISLPTNPKDNPPTTDLPKLSPSDFRTYNRLAEMMDAYHNHFRHTWNTLYRSCSNNARPTGVSIRQFLATALQLCRSLTMHHTIEENYVFPELATRMPIFEPNEHLIKQHEQIHEGIEKLEEFVKACLYGEKELRMEEMKAVMDEFGTVLWDHLDIEVKMLGAENMRKYWSKEEIMNMNW
jgi:phosphatidylinositol 3,5-bisphosphate 5-phosphatase